MNEAAPVVDIEGMPDLIRIVEEVRGSGRPRRLRLGGQEIAEIAPVDETQRPRSRRPTDEDIAVFLECRVSGSCRTADRATPSSGPSGRRLPGQRSR